MILYDDIAFLEHFDEKKDLDKEAGIVEYTSTTKSGVSLNLYMNIYEDTVCFTLAVSLEHVIVSFGLYNIVSIKCDKIKDHVRFLFFQEGKDLPVVTALVRPEISLSLGIFAIK